MAEEEAEEDRDADLKTKTSHSNVGKQNGNKYLKYNVVIYVSY